MLEPQTIQFLKQLKKNNYKEWFDKNRAKYEAARIDFSNFIQLVIDELQKTDTTLTGLSSKDCIFRINRDIRFSKDKTPYKAHFGASIKRGGRKSLYAGYYFHLEPGTTFVGGGLWMPDSAALRNVRQEIDYNQEEFQGILKNKSFKKIFGDLDRSEEFSLSTMPKGYEKDHPAAKDLKLKSFIAETRLTDDELTQSGLHRKTITAFVALKPLLDFLNRVVEEA